MKSKYVYYLMLGSILLLIIALVGGAYGADRLLTATSNQLLHNRLQVKVLAAQQDQLTQAKQDVAKYQNLAVIAQTVVPQDKNQAQTVRQVVDIAKANSIALSSITFPASTLGSLSTGSSTGQALSQLTPVIGISSVYSMLLTVQSDSTAPITYNQLTSFLSALEHNRRTALVNSLTLQPNPKNRSTLSFTMILEEYVKP